MNPVLAISGLPESTPLDGAQVAAHRASTAHQVFVGGAMLAGALLPAGRPDLILGLAGSQLPLLKPFAGPAEPLSCKTYSLRDMTDLSWTERKRLSESPTCEHN